MPHARRLSRRSKRAREQESKKSKAHKGARDRESEKAREQESKSERIRQATDAWINIRMRVRGHIIWHAGLF